MLKISYKNPSNVVTIGSLDVGSTFRDPDTEFDYLVVKDGCLCLSSGIFELTEFHFKDEVQLIKCSLEIEV